jgi:hypothetical protein
MPEPDSVSPEDERRGEERAEREDLDDYEIDRVQARYERQYLGWD